MKTNRNITRRSRQRIASICGIFLLVTACSNAPAQRIAAKQAIFTAKTSTNFAFGSVRLGKAMQKTFYYQNTGSDTLFIQSLELNSDSAFTIQFATLTLPPKGRGKVIVQFEPQARQSYSARLSFAVANGVAAPTVTLRGNGVQPEMHSAIEAAFDGTAPSLELGDDARLKETHEADGNSCSLGDGQE